MFSILNYDKRCVWLLLIFITIISSFPLTMFQFHRCITLLVVLIFILASLLPVTFRCYADIYVFSSYYPTRTWRSPQYAFEENVKIWKVKIYRTRKHKKTGTACRLNIPYLVIFLLFSFREGLPNGSFIRRNVFIKKKVKCDHATRSLPQKSLNFEHGSCRAGTTNYLI